MFNHDAEYVLAIWYDRPQDDNERIILETQKSADNVISSKANLFDFARCLPWDFFSQDSSRTDDSTQHDFLCRIFSSPCIVDSCSMETEKIRGLPQCFQFVYRTLPGVVIMHKAHDYPTTAIMWDKIKVKSYVEVARKHPGDNPTQNELITIPKIKYDAKTVAPVTTKAGSRLWSISFASPSTEGASSVEVTDLCASYPLQLLVRYDKGRDSLIYDCFDFLPKSRSKYRQDMQSGTDVSIKNLKEVERLLKKTANSRYSFIAMQSRFSDNADDPGPTALTPPAPADISHHEKLQHYGIDRLYSLSEYVRFKESTCHRVRFALSELCGARMLGFDC
jgi:hypothetical protein